MGCFSAFVLIGGIICLIWWIICQIFSIIWWIICNVLPVILALGLLIGFCHWCIEFKKKTKNWGMLFVLFVLSFLLFIWMNAVWDWHVFDGNNNQGLYQPTYESHPSTSSGTNRKESSSTHRAPSHSSSSHYSSDYDEGYEAGYEDGYHEDSYDRHKGSSESYDDGYEQGYYDGHYEGGSDGFWDD